MMLTNDELRILLLHIFGNNTHWLNMAHCFRKKYNYSLHALIGQVIELKNLDVQLNGTPPGD